MEEVDMVPLVVSLIMVYLVATRTISFVIILTRIGPESPQ